MPRLLRNDRRSLARDDAVSEVISYTLMFAMGAAALTFSMQMLVDAQEHGADIATAKQVNQLGQASTTVVEDAARAAHSAPNATFTTTVTLPDAMEGRNYTIWFYVPGEPHPRSDSNDCWVDFWSSTDLSPCGDTHTGCPTNAEVRISTGDDQIEETVRLGNLTTGEVLPGTCLVLDTTETVSSSSGAVAVRYERGSNPTITLDAANR